jgi:cellulose synthase/poly-beta-1,6-N-acetylglucosamine synthase-like glycosyltransferase
MLFLFYIPAALLIYFSFRSFRGGLDYLEFVRSELRRPASHFTPFVSIIAPNKGLDEGFSENVEALFQQNYPAYEVLFVVDDESDEAVSVVEDLLKRRDPETRRQKSETKLEEAYIVAEQGDAASASQRPCGENCVSAKLVVASKAIESSQKVENLGEAVMHVSDASRAFVFVDSDARPSPDWLASLVAPLEAENVGAATGYRWFISPTPSFASEMRSAWNASIATALGPNLRSNFCWGGAMAIRRDVFEKLDIRERWRGTLSDDFTVTRAMKDAGLPIHFVPKALTPSVENCSFREMLEFTTRQMKITRVYASPLWKLSFFGSALFNLTLIAAVIFVAAASPASIAFWAALLTIALVTIFSVGKSWLRLKAVKLILTGYASELARQTVSQNTLWIVAPSIFLYNCIAALFSRRITWRGTRYELVSPTETRTLPAD